MQSSAGLGTNGAVRVIDLVKALYDFKGDKSQGQLSFSCGSIFPVVDKAASGWWEGVVDGFFGWFPSTYVSPVSVAVAQSAFVEAPETIRLTQEDAKHLLQVLGEREEEKEKSEKENSTKKAGGWRRDKKVADKSGPVSPRRRLRDFVAKRKEDKRRKEELKKEEAKKSPRKWGKQASASGGSSPLPKSKKEESNVKKEDKKEDKKISISKKKKQKEEDEIKKKESKETSPIVSNRRLSLEAAQLYDSVRLDVSPVVVATTTTTTTTTLSPIPVADDDDYVWGVIIESRDGEAEDEISVASGDLIQVMHRHDGWWLVRKEGGEVGLVPENVVRKALKEEHPSTGHELDLSKSMADLLKGMQDDVDDEEEEEEEKAPKMPVPVGTVRFKHPLADMPMPSDV